MDQTDRNILAHLRRNGRAAYTDIADELGVSEGTVRNRVRRMERDSVIEGYTVETSGKGISAIMMLKLSTGVDVGNVREHLPENTWFYEVTGDYDIVLEIEGENTEALNEEIDGIRAIDGVTDTMTYPILNQGRV